jgi:type II secretory pathway pseudopilin PulG
MNLIICPACGSSVEVELSVGCPSCGARAVGPPLAKPEHQLISYGPAMVASTGGFVILAALLASIILTWMISKGASLRIGTIVNAGEIAAWQLKWIALPVAMIVVWGGMRLVRTIKDAPATFGGLRIARAGFTSAMVAIALVAVLIGITVPERLRRHQWALEAAENAHAYTLNRALLEYRELHGTLPPQEDLINQLKTLPDPDGAIAEALNFVDANGYQASTVVAAAAPKTKALAKGAALRNASLNTTPDPPSVSFTNYELRLPGADKKLDTPDDLIVRDGLIMTVAEFQAYRAPRSATP